MNNNPELTQYDAERGVFTFAIPLDQLSDLTLMTLILNPTIAPDGNTHHRETYVRCLEEKNYQDPFTKEFVSPAQLVENPLMREINYAAINNFPNYEDDVLKDASDYIEEKTGHSIDWFKNKIGYRAYFRSEYGLYRLLKFCESYDGEEKLSSSLKKFFRANKKLTPSIVVSNWDKDEETFTVEIPSHFLMCPDMKKIMVRPVTFENGDSYHARSAPSLRENVEAHAPNNFLKSLCMAVFASEPELDIYNPFELIYEAIMDENTALLRDLIAQFPEKINQLACYEKDKLQTPLMFALEQKKTALAKVLYKSDQVNVRVKDPRGKSALYYALKAENESAIENLMFPMMVKPLLNNAKKYKGKGYKVNSATVKSLLPYQDVMLRSFKNKVVEYLENNEHVEAQRLLIKARSTINYFNQVMHAHHNPLHIRIQRHPFKLSCFSVSGEGLNNFLLEHDEASRLEFSG